MEIAFCMVEEIGPMSSFQEILNEQVRFSSTIEKTTWLKISDQMPNMNVLCKLGINLAGVMQAEYSISSVENPNQKYETWNGVRQVQANVPFLDNLGFLS